MVPTQLVGIGVVMMLVKFVDFTDDFNMLMLRLSYVAAQGACWAVLLFIYAAIVRKDNKALIQVPEAPGFGQDPNAPQQIISMSIRDYHLQVLKQLMTRLAMATVVVGIVHYNWQTSPPLMMQCFLNPLQVFQSTLFSLHVRGEPDANYIPPWAAQDKMDLQKMLSGATQDKATKAKQERDLNSMRKNNRKVVLKSK